MKLEDISQWCNAFLVEHRKWVVVTGVSIIIGGAIVYKVFRKKRKVWPKDKVILHQFGRGEWDFTLTPFGVKLETYLRMANIPYINDETMEKSSKKKTPWIELNGECVADSSFIIDYLNTKYCIDLNMSLSVEQQAIGRGFCKMVDEHLYWTMVMSRWYHDVYKLDPPVLGLFNPRLYPLLRRSVYNQGWAQGVGRHTQNENNHLMYGDLKALSDYLGERMFLTWQKKVFFYFTWPQTKDKGIRKKRYLFGDQPCEVDCVVFGQLSQFCWHMPNLLGEKLIHDTFPNLRDYCFRMKKAFWPNLGTCSKSKC